MEARKVCEQLKYIATAGVTLSNEERMQLEYACMTLQQSMNFETLYLWGKINGIEADYYIVVGQNTLGRKGFPERTLFWCQATTWQFSLLQPAKTQYAPIFEQIQTMFTGESERQIVDSQGFSDQLRLRDGSYDPAILPANGITEQERLSYVVSCIERQCQIVPVGSFRKNTLGYVQKNEAFRGLKFNDLTSLDSFMHLRPCEQKEKMDQSAREEDIFCHDFLDNAALQKPEQGWTVQRDEVNQAIVVLRSRVWPGFTAYARANTSIFGGLYIGNGIKQVDLPFMI